MILLQFLAFRSEFRVLIRLGCFDRRVGVDTVNSFLWESLLDASNSHKSSLPRQGETVDRPESLRCPKE